MEPTATRSTGNTVLTPDAKVNVNGVSMNGHVFGGAAGQDFNGFVQCKYHDPADPADPSGLPAASVSAGLPSAVGRMLLIRLSWVALRSSGFLLQPFLSCAHLARQLPYPYGLGGARGPAGARFKGERPSPKASPVAPGKLMKTVAVAGMSLYRIEQEPAWPSTGFTSARRRPAAAKRLEQRATVSLY